jgi:hypothetical protein
VEAWCRRCGKAPGSPPPADFSNHYPTEGPAGPLAANLLSESQKAFKAFQGVLKQNFVSCGRASSVVSSRILSIPVAGGNGRALVAFLLLTLAISVSTLGQTYTIKTVAGGGVPSGIAGNSASLGATTAVATDATGNVYFTVQGNHVVFRLDTSGLFVVFLLVRHQP